MTLRIAVLILTCNEELHIARCLRSLQGVASDILVVDSFSTDKTVDIAREMGATVLKRPFKNYADQFAWGLSQIELADWVMRMDADEWLDDDLRNAILQNAPNAPKNVGGFTFRRLDHFLGRPIRHGGRVYRLLRLWRHGQAHIEPRWMDEHMVLSSGGVAHLEGWLMHSNDKPLTEWIAKHNSYSNREAIDVLNRKYRFFDSVEPKPPEGASKFLRALYNRIGGALAPILYFFYRYVVRLGFLDGREGYLYHALQGYWYRTLVATKLAELERLIAGCATNDQRLARLQQHTQLQLIAKKTGAADEQA